MKSKLTEKQKRFADYYIETGNAADAYRKAYARCKNDNTARTEGAKNLTKPCIKAYIDKSLSKMDKDRVLSAENAMAILSEIGKGEIKEEVVGFSVDGRILRTKKDANLKDRVKALESIIKRQDAATNTSTCESVFDITGGVVENTIKPFENSFFDILNHRFTHYWFKGGRGSTKSSFISLIIPFLLCKNDKYNSVILRKVGNTLKKSVYNQLLWALDKLEIRDQFKTTTSPLEITKIDTGQKIVFLGCDDPTKVKSLKFENGYPAIVWYEEVDQFNGMEEIRNLNQSLLRGGDWFWSFYSFNPPRSKNNWANEEVLNEEENRRVYHSTYLDVPVEWLGSLFFAEAELLKKKNEMSYKHEYLGEATGTGGNVFDNVTVRPITDDEIANMDRFYYGCDFGFSIDPASWGKFYIHNNKLWIIDEIYQTHLSNKELAQKIQAKNVGREPVIFDSAEPKSIDEIRDLGITAMGAKKGPDSVNFGMKYLQDLDEIIIDKARTPNAAREFIGYEYEMNKNGQFISRYPDKDNHFIDCTRYGLEWFIQQRKGRIDFAS